MDDRYFVSVFAADRRSLQALQGYGFDLFAATAVAARARVRLRGERARALESARPAEDAEVAAPSDEERVLSLADQPSIDGLLTLEEIGRLVGDGYRVLIERRGEPPERPRMIEFEQWLRELGDE